MEILLVLIIVLLIGYLAYRERQFSKERELLMDRIMSKDIAEYKRMTETPKEEEEDATPDTLVAIDSPEAMEGLLHAN